MGKLAKWMIVLGAVVAALPLLAVMSFYVFLNGGIYGTILTMKPKPNLESPGIKRDRARLEADLNGAFQRVGAKWTLLVMRNRNTTPAIAARTTS
jgi:hypothetical protein